jgi:hypothetical protein
MINDSESKQLEEKLREAGRSLAYPSTPPIAQKVMSRINPPIHSRFPHGGWATVALAMLILALALIFVSPARAAIFNFIQIGVVRIFQTQPAAVPTQTLEAPLTATPIATFLPSVLDLAGETTLTGAQSQVNFPILLPSYPVGLGKPDHVYVQDVGSPMLVLVWMDRAHPDKVRLSLDEIEPGWAVSKSNPRLIEETAVNGQPAVWAVGPYLLQIANSDYVMERLVQGNVLIWTQGETTYRLETDLSLEEAVKIAESLQPVR